MADLTLWIDQKISKLVIVTAETQRTQRKNLMPSGKSSNWIMFDINKLSS